MTKDSQTQGQNHETLLQTNTVSQGKSPVCYELRTKLDTFFMEYNFRFEKNYYTKRYLAETLFKINKISLPFQAKQSTYLLFRIKEKLSSKN